MGALHPRGARKVTRSSTVDELIAALQRLRDREGNLEVLVTVVPASHGFGHGIHVYPIAPGELGVAVGYPTVGRSRSPDKAKKSVFIVGIREAACGVVAVGRSGFDV
jgi:hypothetical protein